MKQSLRTLLARAAAWQKPDHSIGDYHSIGAYERFAGIRNRRALWNRAARLAGDRANAQNHWQPMFDLARERCLRLQGLRAYRAQRGPAFARNFSSQSQPKGSPCANPKS